MGTVVDYIAEIANDFKAVNNLSHIKKFEKSEKTTD
ncbi:MAG: hypothetical protein CM15mP58_20290 [Burkholderiaceae bacterium]|nr:MAG: hypothetical protein CM15mP58_20290 [Burkholderiaceae bacterium]